MADVQPASDGYPIKLVRDGTPAKINSSGEPGELFYRRFPEIGERQVWLQRKLMEEIAEYIIGGGLAELEDVQAVIDALVEEHGSSLAEFREKVDSHPRGGFHDGVMMYGRHPEFDVRPGEET